MCRFSPNVTHTPGHQVGQHNFSISYQNIEGLHGSLGCKAENIKKKAKADITFFSETWSCDHDKDIPGYTHYFNDGYKLPHCNKGRSSGGLLLYFRNYLKDKISVLKNTPYVIWLKIDGSLFPDIDDNVIVCATYIPPLILITVTFIPLRI